MVSLVLTLLSLMNPLMKTINYLRIRMAKCLPGILVLTAGMGHLWRRYGYPKAILRIFLWMSSWHHLGRRQSPDQRHHMVQRLLTNTGLTWVTLTPMFCREIVLKLMNMNVCPQTAMFIGLRTFLLIHEYHSSPARLFARASKLKFSDAALRLIASKPSLKMWVVKKN